MRNLYIGVMTGTSADSLDGCIVSFDEKFQLLEKESIELGKNYKKKYEDCIKAGYKTSSESPDLLEVENVLNFKTIELLDRLVSKSIIKKEDINLVALSGQTVFHTYEKSYQIGNYQEIANISGMNICADFRNYDIKKGGMGAPLIPMFHKYLYARKSLNRIVFNIGGISNGTHLNQNQISVASDVGPGNCLLDLCCENFLNMPFDDKGKIAATGKIEHALLKKFLSGTKDMDYPRADDKNDYYRLMDESISEVCVEDLLRTLIEFTAFKIQEFYKFCGSPREVIFHGGGTKNTYLMQVIEEKLNCDVRTTDNEIDSKYVEAAGFAYLAYKNLGEIFSPK